MVLVREAEDTHFGRFVIFKFVREDLPRFSEIPATVECVKAYLGGSDAK